MADTIKKYLDQASAQALINEIKSRDAATLQSAKDYCDGKDGQFEVAGAAATAEANAKAHAEQKVAELADGQVKLNKEAIEKLNGADTVDGSVAKAVKDAKDALQANIDAVDGKANKNAEDIAAINDPAEGIFAKAQADAKEKADAVQENVDELANLIGVDEIPEASTVMGIINSIQESAYDDTALRAEMASELEKKADKTQVATDIADAVKVETDARVEAVAGVQSTVDALAGTHATDKAALEASIALKADQSSLDAVSEVANAAVKQADYDVKVKALEDEDARIAGLVAEETARAAEAEGELDERLVKVEAFFEGAASDEGEGENLKNALDTLVEIQNYIDADGAAADEMIKDIADNAKAIADHLATNHDFASADDALRAALEAEIAKKADTSVVEGIDGRLTTAEGKVSTLEEEMDAVQGAVATKAEQAALEEAVETLEGADTALSDRIKAIEDKFSEGEGSVEDMIADAVAAEAALREAADNEIRTTADKGVADAAAALAAAQVADGKAVQAQNEVDALEEVVAEKATQADLEALADRVTTAEGEIDTLQGEMDAVEEKALANETAIGTINTELAKKANQTDLEGAIGRISTVEEKASANETAIAQANTKHAEDVATLQAGIDANTAKINSFSPLTPDDITAMFAAATA